MADLRGRVVAFLEARRSAELADLIARHGGVPYPVPCLREAHRPDAAELGVAIERLLDDEVQVAIFLTGVGAATVLQAARLRGCEQALLQALARMRVAVRGPKPTAVLRRAGVRIDLAAPEPHTSHELLAALEAWELRGQTVAVQLHGGPAPELRAGLEQRGARVVELRPYVWERPADSAAVPRLVRDLEAGRVHALAVTSAAQVDNLFAMAREHGQASRLRRALGQVPVAAQGPVCAAALEREGIGVAITPAHGHMGALVVAIARYFELEVASLRMAEGACIGNRLQPSPSTFNPMTG